MLVFSSMLLTARQMATNATMPLQAVADGSVNERKGNRDQQHDGDGDAEPERDVRNQGYDVSCSEHPEDRRNQPFASLSHVRPPPTRPLLGFESAR